MTVEPDQVGSQENRATVIIGEHVVPGFDQAHEDWQRGMNDQAATFAGFLRAEVSPPTATDSDWAVIYQFDSVPHLQSWLNSDIRQELLNEGAEFHDRPATQQVLVDPEAATELVTVVVSHVVDVSQVGDFESWQTRMTAAEQKFEGYRGGELFRPVPGLQDEWTAIYRFDSEANLQNWIDSDERLALLAEGDQFQQFELQTIQNSFGSWFRLGRGGDSDSGPDNFKTSIAVWVGLYPTVMFLTLVISELVPDAKLWQTLLVGNLLSSFLMTYVMMPWYVNRLLGTWLTSDADSPQPATNVKGLALSGALVLVWTVIFWLATTQVWHLP